MSGSGVILRKRSNQVALRPKPTSKVLIHRDIRRWKMAASAYPIDAEKAAFLREALRVTGAPTKADV
jgi:hypothetical protein